MSSTIFSGNSRFANDFKSVIDRSVAIASLPLTQMQQVKQTLSDESSALTSLDTRFASIQTAIDSLSSATTSGTYSSSSSDTSVLKATMSGTPLPGAYSVVVTNVGSFTSANGAAGFATVSDPAKTAPSAASGFTLTTGSGTFTITPSTNSLNSLADAINANTSANVRATVINVGPSSAPDYRLSLQSTKLGNSAITLSDSAVATAADDSVTTRTGLSFTSAAKFTLTVEGESSPHVLTGASDLSGLVQKINDLAIAGVTASVVDGALSITKPAGNSLDLTENLVETDSQNLGAQAAYKLNGSDTILSDSRTITLAAGLTADIQSNADLSKGSATSTVTVARSTTGISSAIASFVSAYNTAADEITNHHTAAKSALAGNSILSTASDVLRSLATYSGDGYFTSMVAGKLTDDAKLDIGLSIDNSGKLTFDSSRFAQNTDGKIADLLTLLGDTTNGGFLKTATDSLKSLEDSSTGALKSAITSVKDQITAQDDRISDKQEQIDELQRNLEGRMAAADAAIAMLEQQVSYFTNMFASMKSASESMG